MADLTPTPENPGFRVSKPNRYTPVTVDYACRCGETAQSKGDDTAAPMAAYYAQHKDTCGGRK